MILPSLKLHRIIVCINHIHDAMAQRAMICKLTHQRKRAQKGVKRTNMSQKCLRVRDVISQIQCEMKCDDQIEAYESEYEVSIYQVLMSFQCLHLFLLMFFNFRLQ